MTLGWPRLVAEERLDRAAGCLLGLAIEGRNQADTELGMTVARALVGMAEYDKAAIDAAVATWIASGGRHNWANPGVRAIAIGLWARDPAAAESTARLDAPDADANPAIAWTIAAAVAGQGEAAAKYVPPYHGVIAAAIDGATKGRRAFAVPDVMRVLTWRPDAGLGVERPRPELCWTDDLVDLAEALLSQGQRGD